MESTIKRRIRFMNDLYNYMRNKCLETASVELAKQVIFEDKSLSDITKQNWISLLNAWSTAKNMSDICKMLSGRM